MTIHEMMHQVALLARGNYRKNGDESVIEIPLPDQRKQVIYGKITDMQGDKVGLFYTLIGPMNEKINLLKLLQLNSLLRYSRISILHEVEIALLATFDLQRTSVKECAPIIQEVATLADELEKILYGIDKA